MPDLDLQARLQAAPRGAEIVLPPGTFEGPLEIEGSVVVAGAGHAAGEPDVVRGAATTIVGSGTSPLFRLAAGAVVVLRNLALVGGRAARGRGGAVGLEDATLTVQDCVVRDHRAVFGGAVHVGRGGRLRAVGGTWAHNVADKGGGALAVTDDGVVELEGVCFVDNRAGDGGHHLYAMGAPGRRPQIRLVRVDFSPCPGRGTGVANVRGLEGRFIRVGCDWPADSLKVPQG